MEKQASNKRNRPLSIALAFVIVGVIAAIIYVTAIQSPGKKTTEFYMLSADGQTEGYPQQLRVGDEASVIIGVINREQAAVSYRIEIRHDGDIAGTLGPIVLENGDGHEQLATFTPDEPGDERIVEFLLFKEGGTEVYRSLELVVDVTNND